MLSIHSIPEDEKIDPLDRDALEHEAFASSRGGVYIGRQEYFDRLDTHAAGDGQPLVILGESGAGKSALLANWARRYRDDHPDQFLLMHFIGATTYSSDWGQMLRRIMGEFKRRLDIQQDIPDKPDELRVAFANWLHMAAAKRKVVLIIDALNQLEDREGALDLVWIPPFIPPNVRLILSTLPGRPLDDLTKRGWQTFTVEPLRDDERNTFITEYLQQYTKSLSAPQAERIAKTEQSTNPLYLKVLLEELRLYGELETLNRRIEYYLAARTIQELYEKVLARWEEDYEGDTDMVGDALSLIWASRRGLSETELLEMLGKDGEPLPSAMWSPFYLAADNSLVSRSGLFNFAHEYLRDAVELRRVRNTDLKLRVHNRLSEYFAKSRLMDRTLDELPYHYLQSFCFKELNDYLSDIEVSMKMNDKALYDLIAGQVLFSV